MYGTTGYEIAKEIAKLTAPSEAEMAKPPRRPLRGFFRLLSSLWRRDSVEQKVEQKSQAAQEHLSA